VELRIARWTPPFSLDTEKLRRVLLLDAYRYVYGPKPIPELLIRRSTNAPIDMPELNKLATAKALRGYRVCDTASQQQHNQLDVFRAAVQRAGSYMALKSAIAFRAWRLGHNSVTIAGELGMRPGTVRQHLCRLLHIAQALGYDAGTPHPTRGRIKPHNVEKLKRFLTARGMDFDEQKLEELSLCKGK
jgi:hypothetical protein